jgi:proteasome lid subunit RPN8/RPN11
MRISRELLDDVLAHARAESPNECCGMIASRNGEAVAVHRARNVAEDPVKLYVMDSREQYRIQNEIEDAGFDLGAIYHSHPASVPEPSPTDKRLAAIGDGDNRRLAYPGTLYIIVGLADPAEPDVRAWSIELDEVSPVALEVVP